jgi:hypothetical protein
MALVVDRFVLGPYRSNCYVLRTGHGSPTTLGRERQSNPFLRELRTEQSA